MCLPAQQAASRLEGLLYENLHASSPSLEGFDEDGWGSSEFESYDEGSEVFGDTKSEDSARSTQDTTSSSGVEEGGKKKKKNGKSSKTGDETLPQLPHKREKKWRDRSHRSSLSPETQVGAK